MDEKILPDEKIRILVTEDSPTQRERLKHILEREGYDVSAAGNGVEALKLMRQTQPSLVISDILMPGMDGYGLCREMKKDENLKDIPVILLTALSDPGDVIKGLECGADNFLTKPYNEAYLLYRIQHILVNMKLRTREHFQMGVEIFFRNQKYSINADRIQILNLLLSTYEVAIQKNQELSAMQRQLEAANRELEAFSYSVSHDLRAPLRTIDGFSEALREDCSDRLGQTGEEHLRHIRSAVRKMNDLIDAMLSLSRLTRTDVKRERLDLSGLARTVISELREREPERRVDFVIGEAITAEGDAVMLKAALENLLGNAWKFTGRRDPAKIEFGLLRKADPTYYVRDNGAGFDMTYAGKLFGAFQRLHTATEFPGLGIGLATVRRIIHRHGGQIWAEGETGKGATFYFTLWNNASNDPRPA